MIPVLKHTVPSPGAICLQNVNKSSLPIENFDVFKMLWESEKWTKWKKNVAMTVPT